MNAGDGFLGSLTISIGAAFTLFIIFPSVGDHVTWPAQITLFTGLSLTGYYLQRIIRRNRRFEPMVKCFECKRQMTWKDWKMHKVTHQPLIFTDEGASEK